MALDILHDNWGPYTHTEVENALKAYLSVLENRINQAIQEGGIGLSDLSQEVQALLSKANTALQPENIAAWAKAQNKPGYTADEITYNNLLTLAEKLADMDQKIQAAAQSGDVPDDEMSSTSEKPVQNKVIKAYVDAAVQAVQTALNNLIGGNVQGAIDTFNEVKAFLDGINSSDTLAAKLATLVPQTRTVNGKQLSNNIVIGMADIPGLLQAIANAGSGAVSVQQNADGSFSITVGNDTYVFDDFPTKQDMADAIDDALGEAQVTVVPEGSVGVISSLGSDSDEDALSASMGKKLKVAIITILNSLGNYAFPEGKPTIDWGGDSSVTYSVTYPDVSVTKVTHGSAPDTVNIGDMLEVTLGTNDDLYVIKDSSVKVYMSGVEQSGAYNASTQKVTIAAVTGNVVIVADSMTYVQDNLVLHLDCRHRGGTGTEVSGHWKSLVNYGQSPIDFALGSAVVAADTGMVFDGSSNSYAETDTALNVMATDGTIEVVATIVDSESNNHMNTILVNPIENAIGLSIYNAAADDGHKNATIMMGRGNSDYSSVAAHWSGRVGDTTTDFAIAVTAGTPNGVGHNKGTELTLNAHYHLVVDATAHNKLMIGRSKRSAGDRLLVGTIRSIRVYSGHLSADQQQHNWLIDKKRFNLA